MERTQGTYLEQVKRDLLAHLEANFTIEELLNDNCGCIDDVFDYLRDLHWDFDGITGNASGSYYCSRYLAEQMVLKNIQDVVWALLQLDCLNELGHWMLNGEWERIDVCTRCYYLDEALTEAMLELGWMKEDDL